MTKNDVPRWDLSAIYSGLDDRAFLGALEQTYADVDRLVARYEDFNIRGCDSRPVTRADQDALATILDETNALQLALRKLSTYLYALVTTDSFDDAAAALSVELQTRTAALGPLTKRLASWCASLGTSELAAATESGEAHEFYLEQLAVVADLQMAEAEESLAAQLAPSGGLAWARLHGDISAQLMVDIEVAGSPSERVSMAQARGYATHSDPLVRRGAYIGELAAWKQVEVPLAAALNGAKGEQGVLNARRGWPDDLAPALRTNSVPRVALDAMNAAVVDSLQDFRRYFHAKARLLGHSHGLPWWDLFAPVGSSAEITWSEAKSIVRGAFGGFSKSLLGLADRAFDEQWIDAEIREGKRGGAYCAGVEGASSRVMMNFDSSLDSVSTLAHELGHAYHNVALAERTPLQRRTPMALAETASIFCETLMFETAMTGATSESQRLALLDTNLVGASQVVVDIHSRFLFESELCRRRRRTALSPNDLSQIMAEAQEASYGDGLAPQARHEYMWAVKGHYFTPFYNWPYTYGLLFGIGLFARYQADPEEFRAGYDDLLANTGMADAATLASRFDVDITSRSFWDASLAVIRSRIDEYTALAST